MENIYLFLNLISEILGEWVIHEQHAAEISTYVLNGF